MKVALRYLILGLPILYILCIALSLLNVITFPEHFFYDDTTQYYGDGAEPSGVIPSSYVVVFTIFVLPLIIILNIVYSALKRNWRWFTTYIVLSIGFIIVLYGLKYYWSLQNV
ncbi:hypothetical protein [Photobacterium damselae]|uniref:hypothetical protein n=1 Tax=Photobacterium damselae TaxID=38293 RepID=UPI001F47C786|nr:hypothetical protein [Photobacterium damselae]UKA12888.1 hypothetical protein IHC91_21080 [Photobacterium damselae subsp. damselae]